MFAMNVFRNFFKIGGRRLLTTTKAYPGKKIEVQNINFHYEEIGNGAHKILLLPGALGSTKTDFGPQLEQLDRTKFTLVAWDPPGYGYSRPPDRTFPRNFYYRDADFAVNFMKKLGYQKYSILGWSDGGITALIIAANYSDIIQKIVIWGSAAYFSVEDLKMMEAAQDIKQWNKKMLDPLLALYGEEYLVKMWNDYYAVVEQIVSDRGDICKSDLKKIQCPTLIVHGDKDPLVPFEHIPYLQKHIKNSKLHRMPEGRHNLHLRYAEEFNALVTEFLLQ